MQRETRRAFNHRLLGSLISYGLIETAFRRDLLADTVKPVINQWMADLASLCADVKGQKLKDTDFQAKLEELYKKVDMSEFLKLIEFDRLTRNAKIPDNGAASLGMDFSKIEGLPQRLAFGKQIFALKKGRSIVPHGHDNMCTGFLVLKGDFHGRHYDRIEDNKDHYLLKPTIDAKFKPGETSTISDHKDNVHWFLCESATGFVFNIHVIGYNPDNPKTGSRVYVDPQGEKTASGLIVAKKISSSECHKKYG
jgi:hypothetical protein